jgi:hypothetical protein
MSACAQSMQVRWLFDHRWASPNQRLTLHTLNIHSQRKSCNFKVHLMHAAKRNSFVRRQRAREKARKGVREREEG